MDKTGWDIKIKVKDNFKKLNDKNKLLWKLYRP